MIYDHTCKSCHYLGTDDRMEGEPECNGVDMYICTQDRDPDEYCLIRRYSSDEANYGCLTVGILRRTDGVGDRYRPVLQCAEEQGYL